MSAKDIAEFLPKTVRIAKTPDFVYGKYTYEMETIELKTIDVINSFMNLKEKALHEAYKIKKDSERREAVQKIKRMAYFDNR